MEDKWTVVLVIVVLVLVCTRCMHNREQLTNDESAKIKRVIQRIVWSNGNLAQFREETGIKNINGVTYATLIDLEKKGQLTTEAVRMALL